MIEVDEPHDLSDVQRDVLRSVAVLSDGQSLPQGNEIRDKVNEERSEENRVDETHIYDTLKWLAARQLISTQQSENDNRAKNHSVSERGLSILNSLYGGYSSAVDAETVPDSSPPTPDTDSSSEGSTSKPVSDGGAVSTACSGGNSRFARQMQAVGAAKDLRNILAGSDKEAITLAQAATELDVPRSLVEDLVDDDDDWFVQTTKEVNGNTPADAVEATETALEEAIKDPFSGVEEL